MTTTMGLDQIVKVDRIGRVKTPRERREALLAEFDRSGMSGQKFAAWAGIKYTTFANWLQQQRKQRASVVRSPEAGAAKKVQWLEAVVSRWTDKASTKMKTGGLIVHGPGGVWLEIHEEKQVSLAVQLLRELDGKRRC